MKRSVGLWQLWGFAVTSLLGTLLHFFCDWFGGANWVAPFSGVKSATFVRIFSDRGIAQLPFLWYNE